MQAGALLAAAAVSWACLLSAMDRGAEQHGSAGHVLRAFKFGTASYKAEALEALKTSAFDRARSASQIVVGREPFDATGLSLLGASELALGRTDRGDQAMRVAAELGWRDPATQAYWFHESLAAERYDLAAQRTDALARTGKWPDEVRVELLALEATEDGRAAIADQLAAQPPWADDYVRSLSTVEQQDALRRLAVVRRARSQGLSINASAAAQMTTAMAKTHPQLALFTWTALMGEGDLATTGLWHQSFASLEGLRTPFSWRLSSIGGWSVAVDRGRTPAAVPKLRIASNSPGSEIVARQTTALAPGSYSLRWNAADEKGRPSADLVVGVRCAGKGRPVMGAPVEHGSMFERSFTITPKCSGQTIEVVAQPRSADGFRDGRWIWGIALEPQTAA